MKSINNFMLRVSYLLLAGIVVVLMYEVILRTFFPSSTTWYLEVSSLLGACCGTLGAAYLLQEEGHLGVDIVLERLSPKHKNGMLFFTSVFGVLITLIIVIMLIVEIVWTFKLGKLTDNARIPIGPFQIVSTLGLLLLAVQFALRAKKYYYK